MWGFAEEGTFVRTGRGVTVPGQASTACVSYHHCFFFLKIRGIFESVCYDIGIYGKAAFFERADSRKDDRPVVFLRSVDLL